jgi:hypothetical protein
MITNSVSIITGTEGPKYDPYSYTEAIVEQKDIVRLHIGLVTWISINGSNLSAHDPEDIMKEFSKRTGFKDLLAVERCLRHLMSKCRKCGCKKLHWVNGYPGETFLICDNCKDVIRSEFDIQAVI